MGWVYFKRLWYIIIIIDNRLIVGIIVIKNETKYIHLELECIHRIITPARLFIMNMLPDTPD